MDTKHTPGPWTTFARLSGSENHKGFYVVSPDDWPLCDVMPVDQDGIEGEANASLIAAAPDLLEALRDALEASGFPVSGPTDWRAAEDGEPRWICKAREALAKALAG